jgi:ABC-type uncharacterized transport system fused permease/ATPase subunit
MNYFFLSAQKHSYYFKKPYMTIGTLRDQIIYPDTIDVMKKKMINDKTLGGLLEKVQLQYLVEREKGWDSVQDWLDVLSGGEKQRIAVLKFYCLIIIKIILQNNILDGSIIVSSATICNLR